jgi:lipopolysaccharide/colanic/teichoic acid biosynthesis glycosyltransferase
MLIRALDFLLSLLGLLTALPVLLVLYLVGLCDTGKPLFFQQRVGRQQQPFTLVKFRTMPVNTESVASHLVSGSAVTSYGRFLRRTKLDELPQLWNVLKGEMSLVGPRPCLFNQHELIDARARLGVYTARPGVTGLAQTTGIDMSTPQLLAQTDAQMLRGLTLGGYFRYLFRTLLGQGNGDGTLP